MELLDDILDPRIEAVSGEIRIQNMQRYTIQKLLAIARKSSQKIRAIGPDQAPQMRL